jgi:hypothetical protein
MRHRAVAVRDQEFRQLQLQVRDFRRKLEAEGILDWMKSAIRESMPRVEGSRWIGKQFEGPIIDQDQLGAYAMGQASGFPVRNIFMQRESQSKIRARAVVAIDRSDSEADPEKSRRNVEAALAYIMALKEVDKDTEIAVISFGRDVMLHHAFDQDLDPNNLEAYAHILYSLKGTRGSTDDERATLEGLGLHKMLGTDVGEFALFTDGQGMPGTVAAAAEMARNGYMFMAFGIGPDARSVVRFGDQGLIADTNAQMALRLYDARRAAWAKANRRV